MIKTDKVLYSLDDVSIIPAAFSTITHRSECNPLVDGFLPIFTSPMPCVVDGKTYQKYIDAGINPIIPRNCGNLQYRLDISYIKHIFVAVSLDEAELLIEENPVHELKVKILIDIANGNMVRLMNTVKQLKKCNPNIILMVGNVANPLTYQKLSDYGADYVRLSVGTGSACNTATFTGVYYPMASLIDECAKRMRYGAKIIADGGISNYRNAIKALALGADYVMMGGALNVLKDSAGGIVVDVDENGKVPYKVYYGMSSVVGQQELRKKKISAPEGKEILRPMSNMTIAEFSENFTAYLRSAMSYCNAYTLSDFKKTTVGLISSSAQQQFNKESTTHD